MPTRPKRPVAAKKEPEPAPQLLVTIDERQRGLAEDEIGRLLTRAAPKGHSFLAGIPAGFVGIRLTGDDPRICIARLHAIFQDDPIAFQHTHRWIPVEAWSSADPKEVRKLAQHANAEIAPDESWGIRLERHGSRMPRDELVRELAAEIGNPNVELETPDKTILVEALGDHVALAVVGPRQTLSVDQQMKEDFVRFEED